MWEEKKERMAMEHRSIHLLKPMDGVKSVFRQWHQKIVTALRAVDGDVW